MKFCQKVCNRYLLIVRKNQGDPKIFPGAIKIFPAAWLNPPPPPGGIGLICKQPSRKILHDPNK